MPLFSHLSTLTPISLRCHIQVECNPDVVIIAAASAILVLLITVALRNFKAIVLCHRFKFASRILGQQHSSLMSPITSLKTDDEPDQSPFISFSNSIAGASVERKNIIRTDGVQTGRYRPTTTTRGKPFASAPGHNTCRLSTDATVVDSETRQFSDGVDGLPPEKDNMGEESDVSDLAYIDFEDMMHKLPKPDYVSLSGLVKCVEQAEGRLPGSCRSVSVLGRGHFNTVYKFGFKDSTKRAVRIPNVYTNEASKNFSRRSEVSSMMYIKESDLFSTVPLPRIYHYDLTDDNDAHTPYIIMEVMYGIKLQEITVEKDGVTRKGFDALEPAAQIGLVKSLAQLQASISRPVPFDCIGSLQRSDDGEYSVGPLCSVDETCYGGPYKSIIQLWRSLIERHALHAVEIWSTMKEDERSFLDGTPEEFCHLLQLLAALIGRFVPPSCYLPLVLFHPDLALRNILVHPKDWTKITAVLDWSGVQILPLILTAKVPADLMSEGNDPCTRSNFNIEDAHWVTVPFDWTSIGDVSQWPQIYNEVDKPVDMTPQAVMMVRRYYCRQYYGACFGQFFGDLHDIQDIRSTTVFDVAPYYMKFHEVLVGSSRNWINHAEWVKETYWRLALLPPTVDDVIVGPSVYKGRIAAAIKDLTISPIEGHSPRILRPWQDGDDDELG